MKRIFFLNLLKFDINDIIILKSLYFSYFIFCIILSLGALLLINFHSAFSVFIGAIISLANFYLLKKSVLYIFNKFEYRGNLVRSILIKYYLRFITTIICIFILINQGIVEIRGFIFGLSVYLFSVIIWSVNQIKYLNKNNNIVEKKI